MENSDRVRNGMHLLVTGGAGFIGSNFVRLESQKCDKWGSITVVDALTYAGNKSNIEDLIQSNVVSFHHGNILDASLMNVLTKGIDVVVNFAAESHVDNSIKNSDIFIKTNVLGTNVLLDASKQNSVKHFIQISTDEVYGSIPSGSWKEDDILNPSSPYSASKAGADLLALSYFHTFGMDVRVTRCSNNYGPMQFPEKIIPFFISQLIKRQKIPIYGDGQNIRDWLHVNDHCAGISLVIANGQPGQIYNLGGGKEITNIDLAKIILSELDMGTEFIKFVDDRKGHDFRYSVDCSRANRELGYIPKIDFNEGILKTIEWYLAHDFAKIQKR